MAYTAGNLAQLSDANGYGLYRYDTTDATDVVEDAGYFNNLDDNLDLRIGDVILAFTWTTVRTGTLSEAKSFVVTNVIANDAAASAGAVNVAEIWTAAPTISSID